MRRLIINLDRLDKKIKKFEAAHDTYLCQGGNEAGFSGIIRELKLIKKQGSVVKSSKTIHIVPKS